MYRKAVTFSYDDGVESDQKLIPIFNEYGMKCSFNLNSGLFGDPDSEWDFHGFRTRRLPAYDPDLYSGHEICLHGTRHLRPSLLTQEELAEEFLKDKQELEKMTGQVITGGAYAFGDYDDKTVAYLRSIGIRFCRTTKVTLSCDLQTDLLRFHPSAHHNREELDELIDRFLWDRSDRPLLLYIYGHSYEFDGLQNWDRIAGICERLKGQTDILYGTNTEVFQNFGLL